MTDTPDPRIALLQKWSLENPALMAQAGLTAQPAPVKLDDTLHHHDFETENHSDHMSLGALTKQERKWIKNLRKEGRRVVNGYPTTYPWHPVYPENIDPHYKGFNQQPQIRDRPPPPTFVPPHPMQIPPQPYMHRLHPNHWPSQTENHKPGKDKLTEILNGRLQKYKELLKREHEHITNAIDAWLADTSAHTSNPSLVTIKQLLKAKLTTATTHAIAATPLSTSDFNAYTASVTDFNSSIAKKVMNDVNLPRLTNVEISDSVMDVTHIEEQYRRAWAYGLIVGRIALVASQLMRKMYKIEQKDPPFVSHATKCSSVLSKARKLVEEYLHKFKDLPKESSTPATTKPVKTRTITQLDGTKKTIEY
jgi:hypothetical protein